MECKEGESWGRLTGPATEVPALSSEDRDLCLPVPSELKHTSVGGGGRTLGSSSKSTKARSRRSAVSPSTQLTTLARLMLMTTTPSAGRVTRTLGAGEAMMREQSVRREEKRGRSSSHLLSSESTLVNATGWVHEVQYTLLNSSTTR
jgi:hypothetical protein